LNVGPLITQPHPFTTEPGHNGNKNILMHMLILLLDSDIILLCMYAYGRKGMREGDELPHVENSYTKGLKAHAGFTHEWSSIIIISCAKIFMHKKSCYLEISHMDQAVPKSMVFSTIKHNVVS